MYESGTIANRNGERTRLPAYAPELTAFHRAFERELRDLVASLPVERNMRVIDVGCGDGFYMGLFAQHLRSPGSITGFDSNGDYLSLAQDRLSSRSAACEVVLLQGKLEQIAELAGQLDGGQFDVVWCAQSLFSLPEPVMALEQMASVLRPGGLIVLLENDTLHQLLLPWPSRLELAVRKAELAALCDQTVHADRYYVGRHLPELFVAAGLHPLGMRSQSIDRQSPFDDDLSQFLTAYLSRLAQRVMPYLDSATSRELMNTIDSRTADGLLRQPFATVTWLNFLAWARKGAHRTTELTARSNGQRNILHRELHGENRGPAPASRDTGQVDVAAQGATSAPATTHGGFHLKRRESARRGMRRLINNQIDNLRAFLVQARTGNNVIHDIRKAFKRTRALLRLVRGELGRDVYRQEKYRLRDAAREFRAARDAQVLVETFDEIAKSASGDLDKDVIDRFRRQLVEEQRHSVNAAESAEILDSSLATVRDFKSQTGRWKFKCKEWTDLLTAVRRAYRGARSAWQEATAASSVENLHEWRKQAKYLTMEMDVLKRVGPRGVRRVANAMDRLTKILGEDHDLAALRQRLDEMSHDGTTESALLTAIDESRAEFQRQAFRLGNRLFRKKPQKMMSRLR